MSFVMKKLLLSCLLIGGSLSTSDIYASRLFKSVPKENKQTNLFLTVNPNGSLKKGASAKVLISLYKKLPLALRRKTLAAVMELAEEYLLLLLSETPNSKLKAALEKDLGTRGREEVGNRLLALLYAFGELRAGRTTLFDGNPPRTELLNDYFERLYAAIKGIRETLSGSKSSKTRKKAEVTLNPIQLVDSSFRPQQGVSAEDLQKRFPRIEDGELVSLSFLHSLLIYRKTLAQRSEQAKKSALRTEFLERRKFAARAVGAQKPEDFGLRVFALVYYQAQKLREEKPESVELKALPKIHQILLERDVTLQSKGY
jgi:hypothetical protein